MRSIVACLAIYSVRSFNGIRHEFYLLGNYFIEYSYVTSITTTDQTVLDPYGIHNSTAQSIGYVSSCINRLIPDCERIYTYNNNCIRPISAVLAVAYYWNLLRMTAQPLSSFV